MSNQDDINSIRAYVEQNQATYSRHALRQKLLEAGYDSATTDQVLAELDARRVDQQRDSPRRLKLTEAYLGVLLFGPLNLTLFQFLVNSSLSSSGKAFLSVGLMGALSGLVFLLGRPSLAAGLLSGYALLTLLSGGTCTLGATTSMDSLGPLMLGLFLYPAVLTVLGIALAVRSFSRRQRSR